MIGDILPYYVKISKKLYEFIGNRPLATRIWIPNGPRIIKRGSKDPPLCIKDLKQADKKFFEIRNKYKTLDKARPFLNKTQINIWSYFVPRKLIDLHYTGNYEGKNKPLQRIYLDIDSEYPEKAFEVSKKLIKVIKNDKTFPVNFKLVTLWTGRSFHIIFLLKKEVPHSFYTEYIEIRKDKQETFPEKWVSRLNIKNVIAAHERIKDYTIVDPSQSPSGKLFRAPFSLHIKDPYTIDGVTVPVNLEKTSLSFLKSLTPEKVLKNLDKFKI